ncbi:visual pigment-like receptor peropsin [Mytilus californianus]|uniref:visual pigment-like receptor peropsin n=1 Tax=Mytilus californianus TaxID=6549 RepID=UPI0022450E98|nr:visual pigment-like receptor peropsin [Mytilus californianus]
MCINGFLISSFGTIFTAATSVRGEWIFGESVCQMHSFIVFFLGLAIIATLTSMAIEKYIVIKKESRNVVTKRVCLSHIHYDQQCAFSLAWSPYAIHCVVSMLGITKGMSPFVATIPALIAKSSVIYHPFIYVFKNRPLKTVLLKTLHCSAKNKKHVRGVHCTLPLQEFNGSSLNRRGPTVTFTMDEEADFSLIAPNNNVENIERVYEFPS